MVGSETEEITPFLDYFFNQLRNVIEPSKRGISSEFLTCLFLAMISERNSFDSLVSTEKARLEFEWLKIGVLIQNARSDFIQDIT